MGRVGDWRATEPEGLAQARVFMKEGVFRLTGEAFKILSTPLGPPPYTYTHTHVVGNRFLTGSPDLLLLL